MNRIKKSQAKYLAFFLTGFLIFSLALVLHPSIRSLFPQYRSNLFKELISTVSSPDSQTALVQSFWEFREFYSRGNITLAKHTQITVPSKITSVILLPDEFTPYLAFNSNKITSIEGFVPSQIQILISKEALQTKTGENWSLKANSSQYRVFVNQTNKKALIITRFDLETASKANGYLHFDLREDAFVQQHKDDVWVTISLVELD